MITLKIWFIIYSFMKFMACIFMYAEKASWWPPTYLTCFMSLVCNVILQLNIANTSNKSERSQTKMSPEWFKENKQRCISNVFAKNWLMMQVPKSEVIRLYFIFQNRLFLWLAIWFHILSFKNEWKRVIMRAIMFLVVILRQYIFYL